MHRIGHTKTEFFEVINKKCKPFVYLFTGVLVSKIKKHIRNAW